MNTAEVDALLREHTPDGWRRVFVAPPWDRKEERCRSCGLTSEKKAARQLTDVHWCTVLLMNKDEKNQTLHFTFAMVCTTCREMPERIDALTERAFREAT